MPTLVLFHLGAMALFWPLLAVLLMHCGRPDSRLYAAMGHPVAGTLLLALLGSLGAAIGWLGLYTEAPAIVLDWSGLLWRDGHRLTSVLLSSAYVSSFVIAGMTAAGLAGFVLVERFLDAKAALTGRSRIMTAG